MGTTKTLDVLQKMVKSIQLLGSQREKGAHWMFRMIIAATMGKKKSRSINPRCSAFSLAAAASLTACAHIPEVLYGDVFAPPASYLDVTELDADIRPDARLVSRTVEIGEDLGFKLRFVGAVRKPECGDYCYVLKEPHSDHSYVVFFIKKGEITSWMSFSQLENGR